jgi:tRNA (guanine-N7-)-methyltransferase
MANSPNPAEFGFVFSSARGRADHNPYVEKMREYSPWALATDEAEEQKGQWREALGLASDAPLILEIGPGNGFFFREAKKRFDSAGLIGIEIRFKRVWLTARKAISEGLDHFRVVHHHAGHLPRLFAPGELSAVFANHPDPWPKDRHHKHRLLSDHFRSNLETCLAPGGEFWLKSDFSDYGPIAQSLFETERWDPLGFSDDLHAGGVSLATEAPERAHFWAADIVTNYEQKHIKLGSKILVGGWRKNA